MPLWWSAALAGAMFLLYCLLSAPVSGDKDGSELTVALATGGVAHPTGYPIFTLLGHGFLWVLHTVLGVTFPRAANLWAALGGGVALLLYHRLALRLLGANGGSTRVGRFVVASLPVLVLAFHPVWLGECTLLEVHSWHLAWVCGLALFFVLRIEEPDAPSGSPASRRRMMFAWGVLCGLGGAHHVTAVFFAAGLTAGLVLALARAHRFRWWIPLAWLAGGLFPLLSYGYIAYRAAHPGGAINWPMLEPSWRGVLDHVTARTYHQNLGRWNPEASEALALRHYVYPFLWPGLVLLAGCAIAGRGFARRVVPAALCASAAAELGFIYQYGVSDPSAYFLPPLAVSLLILLPAGREILRRIGGSRASRAIAVAATAAVAAVIVPWAILGISAAREEIWNLVQVDHYLHAMWLAVPYQRAIVLWPNGNYYRLKEYQAFQGEKTDLDVYHTVVLCNAYPRARFVQRYGFDPLANNDPAHMARPLVAQFVIGRQSSEPETHYFALIHQTIVDRAPVPVIAFDPPGSMRVLMRRRSAARSGTPPGGGAPGPAASR